MVEIGVMLRNGGSPQKLIRQEGCPSRSLERAQSHRHIGFEFLVLRTVREYISVILSHPDCGSLLGQPRNITYVESFS